MEHLEFGGLVGLWPDHSILYDPQGGGLFFTAGLAGSLDITNALRLEITSRFENRKVTYYVDSTRPVLLPNDKNPITPLLVDERRETLLHTRFALFAVELGVSWRLFSIGGASLRVDAGVEAGTLMRGTEQREILVDGVHPADVRVIPYRQRPSPLPSTWFLSATSEKLTITNLSVLTLGLQGGVSLDIPVTDRLTLIPSAIYRYPFTEVVPGSEWRWLHMIGGSVDLMWRL